MQTIDGGDLVSGLEAGFGGGHVGLERFDFDRNGLHAGDEAEFIEREAFRVALVLDEDRSVCAMAVVHEGEGDGVVEVEQRADADLLPGGVLDGGVVNDGVA